MELFDHQKRILAFLATQADWASREQMHGPTGQKKGYSKALETDPNSLRRLGLVERRDDSIPYVYRITEAGRQRWLSSAAVGEPDPRMRGTTIGRYGNERAWQIVLRKVNELGRAASIAEVKAAVLDEFPDFVPATVDAQLTVLAVNHASRVDHAVNRRVRRTDSGSRYDALIRIGFGKGVLYTPYDPSKHGIWEIFEAAPKVFEIRPIASAIEVALEKFRAESDQPPSTTPISLEDARRRVVAEMVRREGQPKFRKDLMEAYGNRCAVTGCEIQNLLEAAHIVPYMGGHSNTVTNGLLLRADIHKLFDLALLYVEPDDATIRLSPVLYDSEYGYLDGQRLASPAMPCQAPSRDALAFQVKNCATWAGGLL